MCLYFFSKMHGGQVISIFIFFVVVPLRGHFLHTSPARISISFFLFVHPRPTAPRSEWPKKIFDFSIFHYTLLHIGWSVLFEGWVTILAFLLIDNSLENQKFEFSYLNFEHISNFLRYTFFKHPYIKVKSIWIEDSHEVPYLVGHLVIWYPIKDWLFLFFI